MKMRPFKSKTLRTLTALLIAVFLNSSSLFDGENKDAKENTLSYKLNRGSVDI